MTARREYLKYNTWKDPESEVYAPEKLSMMKSAKFGNCNWRPYKKLVWDSKTWKLVNKSIRRFLKNHVGKSYNKTYSEFREKFPKNIGKINLVEEFKSRFLVNQPQRFPYISYSEDWAYYVDEQGILRDAYTRPTKDKNIKINIRSTITKYSFSENVFKDFAIFNLVKASLSKDLRQYLDPYIIFSEEEYNEICRTLFGVHTDLTWKLSSLKTEEYWINHKCTLFASSRRWNYKTLKWEHISSCLTETSAKLFVFTKYVEEDCDIIKAGSPEHIRYLEDSRKTLDSKIRQSEKEKEKERDELLHNIISERKRKEKERDLINRDRLGFDEYSFIGESYHGQQRKKRNGKNKRK